MKKGITYTTTGERSRSQMHGYHESPRALDHSYGATEMDVKNIKSKVLDHSGVMGNGTRLANYRSKYTIGFEIEKTSFGLDSQKEYALFKGYERDGSCGVEAITNILPLLPPSQWRNKIFDMIFKAKGILDDATSPSDFDCGGHISIKVNDVDSSELYKNIRLNSAILMSMFRLRLKNKYCRHNLRMDFRSNGNRSFNGGNDRDYGRLRYYLDENGWHSKYQFCLHKRSEGLVEFRVPNRIRSYKQMFRRYELMYHIVDFTITKPNGRFSTLLKRVEPTLLSMYEGDRAKVDMILSLAKDFRKFIKDGKISNSIRKFLI